MEELIQKIKSMKPSEHIQNMVDGLRKPITDKINMITFGFTTFEKRFFGLVAKRICYGCAATNAIGRLLVYPREWIYFRQDKFVNSNEDIHIYEYAINYLRSGDLKTANKHFKDLGIEPIKENIEIYLPKLDNDYTKEDLDAYEKLAKFNKSLSN